MKSEISYACHDAIALLDRHLSYVISSNWIFCLHYKFSHIFINECSINEKGHVWHFFNWNSIFMQLFDENLLIILDCLKFDRV